MNEPYVYMNMPDPDICITVISKLIYLCAHSLHCSRHKLTLSLGSSTVFDLFGCCTFQLCIYKIYIHVAFIRHELGSFR